MGIRPATISEYLHRWLFQGLNGKMFLISFMTGDSPTRPLRRSMQPFLMKGSIFVRQGELGWKKWTPSDRGKTVRTEVLNEQITEAGIHGGIQGECG
jgi:hypothetical protein